MDGQILKEGTKSDQDKSRWDLLPYDAVEEVVKVLNFGCNKYNDRNWEKGIKYSRVFGAAIRHLWQWFMCYITKSSCLDPETELSHMAHAACCVLFLLAYEKRGMTSYDDRPRRNDN